MLLFSRPRLVSACKELVVFRTNRRGVESSSEESQSFKAETPAVTKHQVFDQTTCDTPFNTINSTVCRTRKQDVDTDLSQTQIPLSPDEFTNVQDSPIITPEPPDEESHDQKSHDLKSSDPKKSESTLHRRSSSDTSLESETYRDELFVKAQGHKESDTSLESPESETKVKQELPKHDEPVQQIIVTECAESKNMQESSICNVPMQQSNNLEVPGETELLMAGTNTTSRPCLPSLRIESKLDSNHYHSSNNPANDLTKECRPDIACLPSSYTDTDRITHDGRKTEHEGLYSYSGAIETTHTAFSDVPKEDFPQDPSCTPFINSKNTLNSGTGVIGIPSHPFTNTDNMKSMSEDPFTTDEMKSYSLNPEELDGLPTTKEETKCDETMSTSSDGSTQSKWLRRILAVHQPVTDEPTRTDFSQAMPKPLTSHPTKDKLSIPTESPANWSSYPTNEFTVTGIVKETDIDADLHLPTLQARVTATSQKKNISPTILEHTQVLLEHLAKYNQMADTDRNAVTFSTFGLSPGPIATSSSEEGKNIEIEGISKEIYTLSSPSPGALSDPDSSDYKEATEINAQILRHILDLHTTPEQNKGIKTPELIKMSDAEFNECYGVGLEAVPEKNKTRKSRRRSSSAHVPERKKSHTDVFHHRSQYLKDGSSRKLRHDDPAQDGFSRAAVSREAAAEGSSQPVFPKSKSQLKSQATGHQKSKAPGHKQKSAAAGHQPQKAKAHASKQQKSTSKIRQQEKASISVHKQKQSNDIPTIPSQKHKAQAAMEAKNFVPSPSGFMPPVSSTYSTPTPQYPPNRPDETIQPRRPGSAQIVFYNGTASEYL